MKLFHLGRGLGNEIVIQDDSVSRVHAQLYQEDNLAVFVIDLNSTNGTFINGKRIVGRQALLPGDVLMLGTRVVDWVQYVDRGAAAVPGRRAAAPPDDYDEPARKSRLKPVLIGGGILVLATVLVVLFMTFRAGGGSSADLTGRWNSADDAQSWIEFGKEGAYREGFGEDVLLNDARWEKKGNSSITIRRGEISVLYGFKVKGDDLTLRRDQREQKYLRGD
jgi:hypothetical protein